MGRNSERPPLTIPNGQSNSGVLGEETLRYAQSLSIQAPAALTGTVSLQGSLNGSTWADVLSGGNPIVIGAGQIVVIKPVPFNLIRLVSDAAEAAARSFLIYVTT